MLARGVYSFPFQVFLGIMASLGGIASMIYLPVLPVLADYFRCPHTFVGWTFTISLFRGRHWTGFLGAFFRLL